MTTFYSPTRVDLAGGTLDLWPIYLFVGDCVTVNMSIDIFTGADLQFTSTPSIDIEVADLNFRGTYKDLTSFLEATNPEIKLVQSVVEYFRPQNGFHLKTFSQSPVGGGLGGSSSLCVSLIKAFSSVGEMLGVNETVQLAHNLEAKILKKPTGTQDYYPAIQPGLHAIHYTSRGAHLENIALPFDHFASHLLLVYTGKAHHSGINNWEVYKAVIDGDKPTLATLRELADISSRVAAACRSKDWMALPGLFEEEFRARVRLSPGFSSPEIEQLQALVLQNGADAVKICGAGGGGCVLVWADPAKHEAIADECRKNAFRPIKIRPVDQDRPVPPKSAPKVLLNLV